MKYQLSTAVVLSALALTACGQKQPDNPSQSSATGQATQETPKIEVTKQGELSGTYQCYYKSRPISWWEFKANNELVIHSTKDFEVRDTNGSVVESIDKKYRFSGEDFVVISKPPTPEKHLTLSNDGKRISNATQDMHCDKEDINPSIKLK